MLKKTDSSSLGPCTFKVECSLINPGLNKGNSYRVTITIAKVHYLELDPSGIKPKV